MGGRSKKTPKPRTKAVPEPARSCDRCTWRRESPRTDDPPDGALFESHSIEWFARRLLLPPDDPRRGGFFACRCRTCGTRWDVFACYSSSDNSPVPDTTWHEWSPAAWTDAQLQEALSALPQLAAQEKARAERARGESAHKALQETIELRRDQEARRERERPRRVKPDTWIWGPPGGENKLEVWPKGVDYNSVHGHPQDGWTWTHPEFLAVRPDFLPREVYDEAAALVRSLRTKRKT